MKNKVKKITLPNKWNEEESIDAVFIGRGAFATCYRVDSIVYSFVNTSGRHVDLSKEAVAYFTDEENIHIPKIEKLGDYDKGVKDYGIIFKMPYYEKLTASHKIAWNQYKTLKSAWYKANKKDSESWFDFNCHIIESLRGNISESIIDALESINNACTNYSLDYKFEFPTANLKVDSSGNLILLDVIFNVKALVEKRTKNRI